MYFGFDESILYANFVESVVLLVVDAIFEKPRLHLVLFMGRG